MIRQMRRGLVIAIGVLVAMLASLALLWRNSLVLAVLFLVLSLAFWLDRRPNDVFIYIGAVAAGFLAEFIGTASGAWSAGRADVAGIALWLPLGYGVASLALRRIFSYVRD